MGGGPSRREETSVLLEERRAEGGGGEACSPADPPDPGGGATRATRASVEAAPSSEVAGTSRTPGVEEEVKEKKMKDQGSKAMVVYEGRTARRAQLWGEAIKSQVRGMERDTRVDGDDEKNMALYNTLGIGKKATDDEIKKAYRKLALKYHPDKNLDGDPEKTEKFKEINYANGILSNPNKRKVYDEMGDAGLKLMEQFGEDEKLLQIFLKPWFKWVFFAFGVLSCGFCCCCCFCCCCYFCFGRCKPKHPDEEEFDPAGGEEGGDGSRSSPVIATQPGADGDAGNRPPVVIAMPPPSAASGGATVIAMPPPEAAPPPSSSHQQDSPSSPSKDGSHPAQYGSVDLS